ncbi:nucleolar zinc-finger protein [Pichia californica]|uniref:Nucleolar zinc-finger protein n=1 Tax=Pichia californica TaxID=460514 RepID=A0A9P6WPE7_9ASCO|nr:nucleolar zinc-finger protein [[Candida] californica]
MQHSSEEHIDKKPRRMSQETANTTQPTQTTVQATEEPKKENLFQTVGEIAAEADAEEDDQGLRKTGAEDAQGHAVQEVDSLCMRCGETGVTRLLLTSIPYFKEIVLMSFACPHCGFRNSEIQPASEIQEKGSRYVLKIENAEDLSRQVVKSDSCSCKFVELDIEIPPGRGQLISPEGLLTEMIENLQVDQPQRKTLQPEVYEKIEELIVKVQKYINCEPGTLPTTLIVDDPSGNSWIEYVPGEPQHKWSCTHYARTPAQNVQLGLISADEVAYREQQIQKEKDEAAKNLVKHAHTEPGHDNPRATGLVSDQSEIENFSNEVETFRATCSGCYSPCETHMKLVNIPHFKDVVIMSTVCDHCGYKSNEVKTGGEIPDHGSKITLVCDDPEDLARDILKSETCGMNIPELSLDLTPGTLGGRFTTIEGLLKQVRDELHSRVYTQTSDSMAPSTKSRWIVFFDNLDKAIDGKTKFTILMTDPLSSSYIQNVYAPDADPNMTIEEYPRTAEENEELGLTDMKTENYEVDQNIIDDSADAAPEHTETGTSNQ